MILLLTASRCQTFILLGAALYPSKSAHILFIMHWGYHQLPFTYPSSPCNRKLGLSDALPLVEFSSLVGGLWFTRFSLSWSVRADMRRKFSRCGWRCSVEPSNLMTQWGSDAQDPVDRGWTYEMSFSFVKTINCCLSSLFLTHGGVSGMLSRQTTSSSISRLLLNYKIRQCGMWHYVVVGWLWVASSPLKTVTCVFCSSSWAQINLEVGWSPSMP